MSVPKKYFETFILFYSALIALFHFWINIKGGMSDLWFNAAHFSLLGSVGFLIYRVRYSSDVDRVPIYDILLALLTLSVAMYLMLFEETLYAKYGGQMQTSDIVIVALALLLVLELTRRTTGVIIPILMILAICYILFLGQYISGIFAFAGMSVERFFYRIYYTGEGLFGSIATISSTYVFMFILFAAFLLKSGAGDFIVEVSKTLGSRFKGGTGLVAVFSSALMGTISGSAVANTVSTGSITIPMMKKNGFRPVFAAGVETAASTGGQIMPPIMGAGAFIMAQVTHIPFVTIVVLSILPAILYFSSISFYIYIHAKKHNIEVSDEHMPLMPTLKKGFHFTIPIVVLVSLLVYGFTPTYAAGISIIAIIVSSFFSKENKMTPKKIIEALALGTQNMVVTGILLVAIGIIVGVVNISGIGITFSQLVIEWSNNQLIVALILVAIASLILGAGLPVTASYVVLSVLSAPALVGLMLTPEIAALVNMGIDVPEATMYLLAAHLIIFWLSQDSNLTPPVCLAAFAAAAIAKTPPIRTGIESWKLGKGLYIVPLLFAYTPLITGDWVDRFEVFIFATLGILAFAITIEGFWDQKLKLYERGLFAVSCVFLLFQDSLFGFESFLGWTQNVHIYGVLIFILAMFLHKKGQKTQNEV